MIYSAEVEKMCPVAKGAYHGPAPIPEEGKWVQAKEIKDISPFVTMSESTLYPILKRLESAGSLRVYSQEHNGRLRKYYSLTDQGRSRIRDFLTEWEEVMRAYEFIKGGIHREEI